MSRTAPTKPAGSGPSLLDLPNEVLLECLLPALEAQDIAAVSQTNHQLHALAEDETLWLRLTLLHYSYHPSLLAPPTAHSGWSKRIYLGLRSPEATVWGSTDNGRLGVDEGTIDRGIRRHRSHVDHPVTVTFSTSTLPIPRSGLVPPASVEHLAHRNGESGSPQIVDLQAGGYGFTARDADGGVWVWGQLDGSVIGFNQPLSSPHALCARPTQLPLPCRAEAICTGRKHVLVLDSDNLIWEMRSWGLAYHHTAPALTAPANSGSNSSVKHVRQISAGWNHSACLTAKGEIYAWYPFIHAYGQSLTPEADLSRSGSGTASEAVQRWGKVGDVVVPCGPIPDRPSRPLTDFDHPRKGQEVHYTRLRKLEEAWIAWEDKASPKERADGELVVKIASGSDFIAALKVNGEVWIRKVRDNERQSWLFLPHLSGPGITHLTAQYLSITSYSPTSIHHVRVPDHMVFEPSDLLPLPVPALEGKKIIQIASGDYHEVALTEGGEVWTWGQGDHGQLGIGKTIRMAEDPERVIFAGEEEDGKRRFAFGVTAAGWHTGALLLGDDPLHPIQATVSTSAKTPRNAQSAGAEGAPNPWADVGPPGPTPDMPGPHPTQAGPGPNTGLGAIGHPIFRIGFAGRGSAIGNVARRNWQRRHQAEEASQGGGEPSEHPSQTAGQSTPSEEREQAGNSGEEQKSYDT